MLYGVDITNHYDDKGHCYITSVIAVFPEMQLVKIRQAQTIPGSGYSDSVNIPEFKKEYLEYSGDELTDEQMLEYYRPLSLSDIILYCKWAYYNDNDAYLQIREDDKNESRTLDEWDGHPTEVQYIVDQHRYAAPFDCKDSLPRNVRLGEYIPQLGFALRGDCNYITALNTIGRSRAINNIEETKYYDLDFDIVDMLVKGHYNEENKQTLISYRPTEDELHYIPKLPVNSLRYEAYVMGILPSLNRYMTVPNYIRMMSSSVREFLKERKNEFEEYNYFGHTLLRNLAHGKPIDNSNIGVPYTAKATKPALMRVDPYDSGIEFDTLTQEEIFTVYEMGYDDYYFAQCAKPIEEWDKRDENGYAMCTGRMERVWCYVPKADVQILTQNDTPVTPFVDWGIISNANGSVQLYSRSNEKEVIGAVTSGEWVKIISYDIRNYLVETADGREGRVAKESIIW